MNAFTSVRPRAADAPSAKPKRTNHSKAPMEGHLRDVDPAQLHDKEANRKRWIEKAAEITLKQAAKGRASRSTMATPAERARSIERKKDKV